MNRQSSLNDAQAHIDRDGWFRAVISRLDPGVPNWLDKGDYPWGIIQMRWNLASVCPATMQKVPFAELLTTCPPTHRWSARRSARSSSASDGRARSCGGSGSGRRGSGRPTCLRVDHVGVEGRAQPGADAVDTRGRRQGEVHEAVGLAGVAPPRRPRRPRGGDRVRSSLVAQHVAPPSTTARAAAPARSGRSTELHRGRRRDRDHRCTPPSTAPRPRC